MKRWSQSIRFKLLSIFVLTLLAVLVLTLFLNYYQSRRNMDDFSFSTVLATLAIFVIVTVIADYFVKRALSNPLQQITERINGNAASFRNSLDNMLAVVSSMEAINGSNK